MTGPFSLTTRKPLAVLLNAGAIAIAAAPGAAHARQDLRSPDARDAATRVHAATQDLRSPDAREAVTIPRGTIIQAEPTTRIVKITSNDFEWGDAAIGAAGTLGVMVVLAGAQQQQRQDRPLPGPAERQRVATIAHLQRAKSSKLHRGCTCDASNLVDLALMRLQSAGSGASPRSACKRAFSPLQARSPTLVSEATALGSRAIRRYRR